MMANHFHSQSAAYSYLLFISLYIPCVSTIAAIRQEATKKLMWFSVLWSILLAYTVSVLFYQIANIDLHPAQSLAWSLGLSVVFYLVLKIIYEFTKLKEVSYAI